MKGQKKVVMEISRDVSGTLIFEIRVKGSKDVLTVEKYRSLAMHDALVMWANANCGLNESARMALLRSA
ncbi:MAG: hypothetical protein JSR44_09480 [Spirochaetes bacterium]|nr:hypothetical protein [Spirochaetota bacterium]